MIAGNRRAGAAAVCLTLWVCLPGLAGARDQLSAPAAEVTVPRVERPPTLEDFLEMEPNGAAAEKLAKVEGFIQREPSDGQPSTQRTVVYLGYDEKNFYAVFVCFDTEPKKIRARMARRENFSGDDIVEVAFDTFHDQRRAYVFVTNPFGIQMDVVYTEGQGSDASFDTMWRSRGQLTAQGYVVWMAIPFKSLRFRASAQQTWGLVFRRDIPRNTEITYWPHISSKIEGRLNQAATLRGLEDISPGRNLQFIPYGTFRSFRAVDARDDLNPHFNEEPGEAEAGLDAKYIYKDSVVVDVTLNPDFAQVESDQPQVTVNQRFEVFFPEKRPFFLENANYFRTPIELLFTRRIADPQYGVRLTGKVGPYQLGAFVSDDESPGKLAAPDDPEHGKRAFFGIIRGSQDIFRQSTLGFIYTGRKFEDEYNHVGGVDARLKLSPNWVAEMQAVTSWTRDEDGNEFAGPAYRVGVQRSGRQLNYELEYDDYGRGFETAPGFVPRVDIRRVGQEVRYNFRPEGRYLISWGPNFNTEVAYDHSGTRLDLTQDIDMGFDFRGNSWFYFGYHWDRERLRPEDFDLLTENRDFQRNRKIVGAGSSYFRPLSVDANYNWGTRINFVPPFGVEPFLADVKQANVRLTLRPLNPLRIENTFLHTRLTDRGTGENIFNNHILRSNWNWQFTRELSLRVILQYNAVLANPEHTALATSKNFNADFLLTFFLHPGTALYIGYNSNAQNLDPALMVCQGPGVSQPGCPGLEVDETDLLRRRRQFINDGHQFFVKFSYLFRF